MNRKLSFAAMGENKLNSVTFIESLANPEAHLGYAELCSTKVPVYYHFSADSCKEIVLEQIRHKLQAKSAAELNQLIRENPALSTKLGLEPVDESMEREQLAKYVDDQFKKLEGLTDWKRILSTLSDPILAQYLTSVTLRVPACDPLAAYMRKNNCEIEIRGLMEPAEGKVERLSDAHLDGLDGILLLSGGNYPRWKQFLQESMVRTVLGAVPCFLVGQSDAFFDYYLDQGSPALSEFQLPEQYSELGISDRKIRTLFYATHQLLAGDGSGTDGLQVMERCEDPTTKKRLYRFKNFIAPMEKMQLLVSELSADVWMALQDGGELGEEERAEWLVYQHSTVQALCSAAGTLLDYQKMISDLAHGNFIWCALKPEVDNWQQWLIDQSENDRFLKKVSIVGARSYSLFYLNEAIHKANGEFLGKYGGITTLKREKDGNGWRYAPAMIGAAGAYQLMLRLANLCDEEGNPLELSENDETYFEEKGIPQDRIRDYWSQILRFALYQVTDTGASANGRPILDRYLMKEALQMVTRESYDVTSREDYPFLSAVREAVKLAAKKCNHLVKLQE